MGDCKFRAFISYSHADEEWGAWLQRSLERFRAPKDLERLIAASGRPARLAPVFRDREDLPVAGNLNDAIRQALADSEFQIVLCSPNAAKSRWVNEEIKLFNRLHGSGRTFAIIVAGEPGDRENECFPPALRFKLDAQGEPTAEPHEPLAADAREHGDGKRYAILKTAAGMLGVGLDDLVRREAKARARRTRAVVLATSGIAASMTFAAVFAFQQRNEASAARGRAEALVEFMLRDLSDRLEPVGRLDILEEVGGKVLDYYADQDIKMLDAEALSRRATALMKLGQVDERRGDLDAALKAYEAAFASTAEQLRRAPNDPDRIFDHAQSVFYLASISVARGDYEAGERQFREYYDYAKILTKIAPGDTRSQLELTYATNNLGALAYNRGQYAASIPYFEKSLAVKRMLAADRPEDRKIHLALASTLSWLAYAKLAVGENSDALDKLKEEISIYENVAADDEDFLVLEKLITAERRASVAHLSLGDVAESIAALERAAKIGETLVAREPDNLLSLNNVAITLRLQSNMSALAGDSRSALTQAESALASARAVVKREPTNIDLKTNLGYAHAQRIIVEPTTAAAISEELDRLLRDPQIASSGADPEFRVRARLAQAIRARSIGRADEAKQLAGQTITSIGVEPHLLTAESQRALALLMVEAGDRESAIRICNELFAKGIRHPELMGLRQRLNAGPEARLPSRP